MGGSILKTLKLFLQNRVLGRSFPEANNLLGGARGLPPHKSEALAEVQVKVVAHCASVNLADSLVEELNVDREHLSLRVRVDHQHFEQAFEVFKIRKFLHILSKHRPWNFKILARLNIDPCYRVSGFSQFWSQQALLPLIQPIEV